MNIIDDLQYLKETKNLIKQAIEDKGVEIDDNTTFRQYSEKISEITGGTKKERFIKIGTGLVNNNGVYSNFSNDSYISLKPFTFNSIHSGAPEYPTFEFNLGFKTVSNFDADYCLINNTGTGAQLNDIFTDANANLCYWSGNRLFSSTISLEPSTNYILKYSKEWNGVAKVFIVKDNNYTLDTLPPISDWTECFRITIGSFDIAGTNILIGKNLVNQYYPGEIDMNKCNYIQHGVEFWRAIS